MRCPKHGPDLLGHHLFKGIAHDLDWPSLAFIAEAVGYRPPDWLEEDDFVSGDVETETGRRSPPRVGATPIDRELLLALLPALVPALRGMTPAELIETCRAGLFADPLYPAARRAGVEKRVWILRAPAAVPVFTAGFLRPRIYVSRELFRALTPAELEAGFRHELEHVRRHDPLRLALVRFFGRALFWVPLAGRLAEAAAEAVELRADDAAARFGRLELAGAIVKTARLARATIPAAVLALGRVGAVRRARRLLGEPLPKRRLPTLRIATTALVLSLVWGSALLAGSTHPQEGGAPCNTCIIRYHLAHWFGARPD